MPSVHMMQRLTLLLLASFGAPRCGNRKTRISKIGGIGPRALSLWQNYVNSVVSKAANTSAHGIQATCIPQLYEARGPHRGVIMLHHGFTACPQQFDQLVPLLTAKGYAVLTPLNPGHGYNYDRASQEVTDYINDLPTDTTQYHDHAHKMHDVMMAAAGEKVLFGHSLGGGIAAYQGYLGGYSRRFLAAPMIQAAGILNIAITAANNPLTKNNRFSWGDGCEHERSEGRAGICQFTPVIGKAARELGLSHSVDVWRHRFQNKPVGMQIVFVDGDTAVSTSEVQEIAIKYGFKKDSPYVCGMEAAVGHSFLSTHDNPDQDKYWLTRATQEVADYLTSGHAMNLGSGFADGGWHRCSASCRNGDCSVTGIKEGVKNSGWQIVTRRRRRSTRRSRRR